MKMLMMLVCAVGLLPFGILRIMFGAGRLLIGLAAALFALLVMGFALAVSAVVGSLTLAGLILLAVALPFLAPLIVLAIVIALVARHASRRKYA